MPILQFLTVLFTTWPKGVMFTSPQAMPMPAEPYTMLPDTMPFTVWMATDIAPVDEPSDVTQMLSLMMPPGTTPLKFRCVYLLFRHRLSLKAIFSPDRTAAPIMLIS